MAKQRRAGRAGTAMAGLRVILAKAAARPLGRRELRVLAEAFYLQHGGPVRAALRTQMGWRRGVANSRSRLRATLKRSTDAQLRALLMHCALAGPPGQHGRPSRQRLTEAAGLLAINVAPPIKKARRSS